MRRFLLWSTLGCASVFLMGCPKGDPNFHAGVQAEQIQDYDTALVQYQRALRADPTNLEYKVKVTHLKFVDAQYHVDQGNKALALGNPAMALAEFQKAQSIDPSNATSAQQVQRMGEWRLRPINVRVVAATSRNLEAEVAQGRFRPFWKKRRAFLA